eukprot:Nk52_evm7s745 gene=Nk52_evmTU7s745
MNSSTSSIPANIGVDEITRQVEAALAKLYGGTSSQVERKAAETWLSSLTHGDARAWDVAWELIRPSGSNEANYFGSQILHVRINKYWSEVPETSYTNIRDTLIEQCILALDKPANVSNKLNAALAALVMNLIPDYWEHCIIDIIGLYRSEATKREPTKGFVALFRLLAILGEDASSVGIDPVRTKRIRQCLSSEVQAVVNLLGEGLGDSSPIIVKNEALRCLKGWVNLGMPFELCLPLASAALNLMHFPEVAEPAANALEDILSSPEYCGYANTIVERLIVHIPSLNGLCAEAVQDEDEDTIIHICRVVVAAIESYPRSLLKHRELASEMLLFLVQFTGMSSDTMDLGSLSRMTFNCWYVVQEEIVAGDSEDDDATGDVQKDRNCFRTISNLMAFKPHYLSCLRAIFQKCLYDKEFGKMSKEDKSSFSDFRRDAADTLLYVYRILKEDYVSELVKFIDEKCKTQEPNVCEIECALFCLTSVAEESIPTENQDLRVIFNFLGSFLGHDLLTIQALQFIGAFSEWINGKTDLLKPALDIVFDGLRSEALARPASLALNELCENCGTYLKEWGEPIVNACLESISKKHMKAKECSLSIRGLSFVISLLPYDQNMMLVQKIVNTCKTRLSVLNAHIAEGALDNAENAVILELKIVWSMCHHFDLGGDSEASNVDVSPQIVHPVELVLRELWPCLLALVEAFSQSERVVEQFCKIIDSSVRSIGSKSATYFESFAEPLCKLFSATGQPVTLDSLSYLVVLTFSAKSELVARVLNEICSMAHFRLGNKATDYPDVITGILNMGFKYIKYAPAIFLAPEQQNAQQFLWSIAQVGLTMSEHDAVKASANFMSEFLNRSEQFPAASEVAMRLGYDLLCTILQCVSRTSPRSLLNHLSGVLFSLNKNCKHAFRGWIAKALSELSLADPPLTEEEKSNFVTKICKESVHKTRLRGVVMDFALACRQLANGPLELASKQLV